MQVRMLISLSSKFYYHASRLLFTHFDLNAKTVNRGSNASGIYFAETPDIARKSAPDSKYLYKCSVLVPKHQIFRYRKTRIDQNFIDSYRKVLIQRTNYKADWVDNAMIPELLESGVIQRDFSGDIKTAIYVGAGYKALEYPDMFGLSLVVFDSHLISMIETAIL